MEGNSSETSYSEEIASYLKSKSYLPFSKYFTTAPSSVPFKFNPNQDIFS
jgi:hypothetical protein